MEFWGFKKMRLLISVMVPAIQMNGSLAALEKQSSCWVFDALVACTVQILISGEVVAREGLQPNAIFKALLSYSPSWLMASLCLANCLG